MALPMRAAARHQSVAKQPSPQLHLPWGSLKRSHPMMFQHALYLQAGKNRRTVHASITTVL